jgi:hypothetical protein
MSHPNMSYCQWQNTALALQQVAADFEERTSGYNTEPLSRDEQAAMVRCFRTMRDLMEAAQVDDDTNDAGEQALSMLAPE